MDDIVYRLRVMDVDGCTFDCCGSFDDLDAQVARWKNTMADSVLDPEKVVLNFQGREDAANGDPCWLRIHAPKVKACSIVRL